MAERRPSQTSFVQIKCDGQRPCANCRAANFPCESKVKLTKQSTPRSYVQYLEARVRELENRRDNEWKQPKASSSREASESERRTKEEPPSPSPKGQGKRHSPSLPSEALMRSLGAHVVDEDGYNRYMGPSSGIAVTATIFQHVLGQDQPSANEFYALFGLDDLRCGKMLDEGQRVLWKLDPTNLPDRDEALRVLNRFILFTERTYPVLHGPSFLSQIVNMYDNGMQDEDYELVAQLYFAMSIGYYFDIPRDRQGRIQDQINAIQAGCRCHFTTLHSRIDGITRLQSLALYSHALVLLNQRSEATRMSSMAVAKALDSGLHHDGMSFHGNPLETEMRRRVFWSTFMLHLLNSAVQGLPRFIKESDVTTAEPSDIDDDQLKPTEVLNSVPGRTKIHRFVTACRLTRILSRTLDVLYSSRVPASGRIQQMNRLCCEHLLEQMDFSFDEEPDDLPDLDSDIPEDLAVLASYANEQMLFHSIRWMVHRPGLSFSHNDSQFASCVQGSTDAAIAFLRTVDKYQKALPYIGAVSTGHPLTIFLAALTVTYRSALVKTGALPSVGHSADDDRQACQLALNALIRDTWDKANEQRTIQLRRIMTKVYGSITPSKEHVSSEESEDVQMGSSQGNIPEPNGIPGYLDFHYHDQRLADMTEHDNLRHFVHEAFSPAIDAWAGWDSEGGSAWHPFHGHQH